MKHHKEGAYVSFSYKNADSIDVIIKKEITNSLDIVESFFTYIKYNMNDTIAKIGYH